MPLATCPLWVWAARGRPVVDAVATPNGNGDRLLYANGAVAAFGAATDLGGPDRAS